MPRSFAFTGTRKGLTPAQRASLQRVLERLHAEGFTIAHNGSAIGADYEAALICRSIGFYIIAHPSSLVTATAQIPFDETHPPAGAKKRDRDMVRAAEVLVACPVRPAEDVSSGTWYTIRYAQKQNVPVKFVWPDGTVTAEAASSAPDV